MSEPTKEQIYDVARNEHHKTFKLGEREFPIKDLDYDSYLEFMELSYPIIQAVTDSLELTSSNGEPDVAFNPATFDVGKIIKLAGSNLPRMTWLCCKQSDPAITIPEVKRLARRPHVMIQVVFEQIKHNKLVEEIRDFFQSMAPAVRSLAPEAAALATPVPVIRPTESQTEETRS